MTQYDVFNGDADGICALIQHRLANPADSELVTGVKRDIALLNRVAATEGDQVTVLDISMDKNTEGLDKLLSAGASVFYVDHHLASNIPDHPALEAIIDTSADTCTSLLMDDYLQGQYREWAVVAAFGDNMLQSAIKRAKSLAISEQELEQLKRLGISINYNGYGSSLDDLHFHPAQLYQAMVAYTSPFDFINDTSSHYQTLQAGYDDDMQKTTSLKPTIEKTHMAVYQLPNEVWVRRVSGVFGNQLANQYPERAHAIITPHVEDGYVVSVRAPLNNLDHAGELCKQFPTGGGRKGAAGINQLAESDVDAFIELFDKTYR
ncbi:MAG: Acetyltransferase [uncultured Thiotrichaceae bacterium]|uniref:Acetyltransferase n=1 Tax=uncultured Thiotrichaceae bacterium TaxID=298394 RepID=A0A6S6RYT6_9GAMM|nr:MAG: Acetyltransferase [uncultured Thiotrichaceae bacterium]